MPPDRAAIQRLVKLCSSILPASGHKVSEMDRHEHLIDTVTLGAANTSAKKYADALATVLEATITLCALNAYNDPNGNLSSVTLAAAITEAAADAASIQAQLNAFDGSIDTRLSFSLFTALTQATLRSYENRITTLEAQVAAMA